LTDINAKCLFADKFPDLAVGRFCKSLESFEKAREQMLQEAMAQIERQEQLSITDQMDISSSSITDIEMNCNNLADCLTIISRLADRVNKQDVEITSLRERHSQLEDYIRHEFSKIIPEAEKEKSTRNEDIWLYKTWKVSNKTLYFAANDHGTSSVTKLFDKVFTQNLLRQYSSHKVMPNRPDFRLKDAYTELLGMLVQSQY
jgi:hypothetical protein